MTMRVSKRNPAIVLLMCLVVILSAVSMLIQTSSPVRAQSPSATLLPVSDNDVNRVARNLYCPVCQNVPLEVCETAACADWREQIRTLLAQGYTDEQVRQYFVNRFGSKTVGMPQDASAQLLTILLPFGVIAVIGVVIGINLVVWRRNRQGHPSIEDENNDAVQEETVLQDDYRTRLEAELKERG